MAIKTHGEAAYAPTAILKRDGTSQRFDPQRIISAIARAGAATGEFDAAVPAEIARIVVHALTATARQRPPTVEAVQDVVERALIDAGYVATARAYIVYREQHKQLRQDRKTLVDVESSMEEYLEQRDWRVN